MVTVTDWCGTRLRGAQAAVVAALVPVALVTMTLAPATAWAQNCAGAPGVGDSYYPLYGNGGYNVKHYRLKLDYDPATDNLVGVATITALAKRNLCRFNLDLQGMTVRSVVVDGAPAGWARSDDHELIVTPQQPLTNGQRFVTVVHYDGVPRTQEDPPGTTYGWIHTDDGAVVAGEPEGAANWFPVNDHPTDPATFTFVVTVPDGLVAIANGHFVDRTTRNGKTTWTWNAPDPMAPYLATLAIGQFDFRSYQTPGGLPMYDAVDPDLYNLPVNANLDSPTYGEIADGSLARQGEILDFLVRTFGPYPFSSGGGIVDDTDDLTFALETQTRSIYPKTFFNTSRNGDFIVVHETAHQWFGDSVRVAEWKHIWLNEGFARYAEWLWSEEQGSITAQGFFDAYYNVLFPANDPFWNVVIGDPGIPNLFHSAVYERGAMTLHVLRNQVGDAKFFRILRAWARNRAGRTGTIPQFIALAERISGQDLTALFDAWLFTPGRPALSP